MKDMKLFRVGQGFTIVELLIVIVVIAILAAITIVGYNGITSQAESSKRLVSLDAYEKALRMYYELHGEYPVPDGERDVAACLGSKFANEDGFQQGECILINGSALPYYVDEEVNAKIREVADIGAAEFPSVTLDAGGGLMLKQRGILYYASNDAGVNSGRVTLTYYTTQNAECGRGVKGEGAGFATCQLTIRDSL